MSVKDEKFSILISFPKIFHVRINHPGIWKCFSWNWHFCSWTGLMAMRLKPKYQITHAMREQQPTTHAPTLQVQYHTWMGSCSLEQSNCSHRVWNVLRTCIDCILIFNRLDCALCTKGSYNPQSVRCSFV